MAEIKHYDFRSTLCCLFKLNLNRVVANLSVHNQFRYHDDTVAQIFPYLTIG